MQKIRLRTCWMYARTIGGPSCRRWWRRRAGRALVLRMIMAEMRLAGQEATGKVLALFNLRDARERVGAARC